MTGPESVSNRTSSNTGIEIRRASLHLAEGAAQSQQLELVELAATALPETAVAIVFDLSDSCGPMPTLLSRLPALLARLRRKWPVWIYRLGNATPLFGDESLNVGHLVDGSIDVSSILADRSRRQVASASGSFVGIVTEAIHERRAIEGLEEALVFVITDGKLTDFSPVAVLPGLRLIGLTDNVDNSADLIWRQVFPNHPLFRLADPDLDPWLGSNQQPSSRKFRITVQGDGVESSRYFDSDGNLQTFVPVEWDFGRRPHKLLLPSNTANSFTIVLSPVPSGPELKFSVSDAQGKPTDESVAAATAAIRSTSLADSVLIDCSFGERGFDDLWKAAAAAAQCCDQKRRWRELLPATNPILRLTTEVTAYRAALCLCLGNPIQPATPDSRVFVIGLRQCAASMINWEPMQSTPFGIPVEDWRLWYDQMEGRWMLCRNGEKSIELTPQGSQRLGAIKLVNGGAVEIFFSGDL